MRLYVLYKIINNNFNNLSTGVDKKLSLKYNGYKPGWDYNKKEWNIWILNLIPFLQAKNRKKF